MQDDNLTKKYNLLRHNQRITCIIYSDTINDCKISIDTCGNKFICQNISNGDPTKDRLGYKYSYSICNYQSVRAQQKALDSIRPTYKYNHKLKVINHE